MSEAEQILASWRRGEIADPAALARLLAHCRSVEALRRAVAGTALCDMIESHAAGLRDAENLLRLADDVRPDLAAYRRFFDDAAAANGLAGVALHSLGDEWLLSEATRELVDLLRQLGVGLPGQNVLDLGCGIGRLEVALAPHVASITGIDLSPEMIRVARQRCAALGNVRLEVCDGMSLDGLDDAVFDAVVAVDVFPYLYQAGGAALAQRHVLDTARVLRVPGELVVLNLSYRGDPAADLADARTFARLSGLSLKRAGTSDLRSWDGQTFHFRKQRA
jgi:SAM-dependent methyltransferase